MLFLQMIEEALGGGIAYLAFGTVPLPPVITYLVVIPVAVAIIQMGWLRARFEGADVWSKIPEYMPPVPSVKHESVYLPKEDIYSSNVKAIKLYTLPGLCTSDNNQSVAKRTLKWLTI